MSTINTVGIIAKPGVKRAESLIPELLDWLEKHGIVVLCDASTAGYANRTEFFPREDVPDGADMVIVLGGDGRCWLRRVPSRAARRRCCR